MLSKKKKIIILVVMLVLLVGTGYLNVVLNSDAVNTGSGNVTTGNFFTTYRSDRESVRDQEMLYYDAIIASQSTSAEAKTSAEQEKAGLVSLMETELVTEGLLKSRGFDDAIITFNNDNVNVLVKVETTLTSSQVAQIVDIIKQQTDVSVANITVVQVS